MQQKTGAYYERRAKNFLLSRMWRLVAKNYSCRIGEIDLIMQNFSKSHLIFVEVRYRHSNNYGGSINSVDIVKQRKIINTSLRFLQHHPQYYEQNLRFDVICFDKLGKLYWIKDAFRVE